MNARIFGNHRLNKFIYQQSRQNCFKLCTRRIYVHSETPSRAQIMLTYFYNGNKYSKPVFIKPGFPVEQYRTIVGELFFQPIFVRYNTHGMNLRRLNIMPSVSCSMNFDKLHSSRELVIYSHCLKSRSEKMMSESWPKEARSVEVCCTILRNFFMTNVFLFEFSGLWFQSMIGSNNEKYISRVTPVMIIDHFRLDILCGDEFEK